MTCPARPTPSWSAAAAGGAALTGVLAQHSSQRLLLLEAGPDYGPRGGGQWPDDVLDARVIPLSHDWGLSTGTSIPGRVVDLPRRQSPRRLLVPQRMHFLRRRPRRLRRLGCPGQRWLGQCGRRAAAALGHRPLPRPPIRHG